MAIGIKVKKAQGKYDLDASKFFGSPTIPLAWENDFCEDEIFFCQIRLADIAPFDSENQLPHSGYLYIFLHTENGHYGLRADVRYFDGEPELILDDFNACVPEFEGFTQEFLMNFYEVGDDEICTKLFGEPSDWNYEQNPPKLLMQFDPLDNEMGFLDFLDGFLYFFFAKNEKDFKDIKLVQEYS